MKKILVAGAGHGGITCAYNLAKAGYDVTVIEKNKRDALGYDWDDSLSQAAFIGSGIPCPEEKDVIALKTMAFTNPSFSVKLTIPPECQVGYMMDRKVLINYIISHAESAGVKFIFEADVKGAITKGSRVTGLNYCVNGKEKQELCDLVVDAAGMYSPVRENLPSACGIKSKLTPREIFHVYRAYYNNTTGETVNPAYTVDLFHECKPGIDWSIIDKEYVDILVGKFGSSGMLTDEEIEKGISDYRNRLPFMGDKIIRGGYRADIPLTKMLPMIICDGYAAVGDSAGMTFPLNGSGIILSMKAGKILADTVIEAGNRPMVKTVLWKYQYNYFQNLGKDLIFIDIMKNFFTVVDRKHVDYFLEKNILTAEMLAVGDGNELDVSFAQVMHILAAIPGIIELVPDVLKWCKGVPFMDIVAKLMPKDYDKKKVNLWLKLYNAL